MIQLKHVSLTLNEKTILDSVNINIKRGETFVFLGPSGAGKSSVLKVVAGLWKPNIGSVKIDETEIVDMPERELFKIRKNIGFVFQGNALFDSLTVEENVAYYLTEHEKIKNEIIDEKVREVLAFVNMQGTEKLNIDQLSGGMKKRVAIARALVYDPEIILYDEPTTGLDPINTRAIINLINQIKVRGKTSIVVTHILDDAFDVADKLAVIEKGRIIESGDVEYILHSEDTLVRDFLSDYRIKTNSLTG